MQTHLPQMALKKTLWQMKKLLIMINFSFDTMFSTLFFNSLLSFVIYLPRYSQGVCLRFVVYWQGGLNVSTYLEVLKLFPHIDAFRRLCSRLFENMATKEEIAPNKQFLLLSPCFQIYLIIVLSFKGSFQNI